VYILTRHVSTVAAKQRQRRTNLAACFNYGSAAKRAKRDTSSFAANGRRNMNGKLSCTSNVADSSNTIHTAHGSAHKMMTARTARVEKAKTVASVRIEKAQHRLQCTHINLIHTCRYTMAPLLCRCAAAAATLSTLEVTDPKAVARNAAVAHTHSIGWVVV
jgi:hypothetical protein